MIYDHLIGFDVFTLLVNHQQFIGLNSSNNYFILSHLIQDILILFFGYLGQDYLLLMTHYNQYFEPSPKKKEELGDLEMVLLNPKEK